MKFYQFNENIEKESVEKLITFLNENHDKEVSIYLTSGGGGIGNAFVMQDAIEKHGKVNLIASILIGSAAFGLFFTVKCKKKIMPFTRGMWHIGRWDIGMDYRGKAYYSEDEFIRKDIQTRDKDEIMRICNLVKMDKKDIKKITKGEEAWFNTEQLNKFLKNAKTGKILDKNKRKKTNSQRLSKETG